MRDIFISYTHKDNLSLTDEECVTRLAAVAGRALGVVTQADLADLLGRLEPLRRGDSPFGTAVPAPDARGAQWVHPRLIGEVAFTEWTSDKVLRHPSWRGLRTGTDPSQVHQDG